MSFDLRAWCKASGFAWSQRIGEIGGDLVCQLGIVTTADHGRLVAVICADEPDDDEPFDPVQAIARVSLKRINLGANTWAFEFDSAHLGNIAVLLRPCRDWPHLELPIPARAVHCRFAWRDQRRKAIVSNA